MVSKGVNYNANRVAYQVTDAILHRDFARFQKDGLDTISISLYWTTLEGDIRGNYDGYKGSMPYGKTYLEQTVKHIIRIATLYNLKVLVSFHTLWGTGSVWCTPDYVIDPETSLNDGHAIVKSEEMKQAFLDMVEHTVTYLKDENIWAYAILNEPWGEVYVESFIDLFQRESALIKSITGKPVTIRFVSASLWTDATGKPRVSNHFTQLWKWDTRVFDALDFISLNTYIPKDLELVTSWTEITRTNIEGCLVRGKRVWIAELGFNSDDDFTQEYFVKRTVELLKELPLDGWLAWVWNPVQLIYIGKGYNLLKYEDGTPRLAYYVVADITPPEPPIVAWWRRRSTLQKASIISSIPLSILGVYSGTKRRG